VVDVEGRTFENPDMEGRKERVPLNSWTEIPPKGGLLVARVGGFAAAIVLAPEVHDLKDLQTAALVRTQSRTLQSVLTTLDSIDLWASARLSGNFLSGTRQRTAMRALVLHLHSMICGETWERIEGCIDEYAPDRVLKALVSRPQELAIATALLEELPSLLELTPRERAEWLFERVRKPLDLVRVHRQTRLRDGTEKWITIGADLPFDPQWLVEFALRLASDPAHLRARGQDFARGALERILSQPAISRMARLMVMIVDRQSTAANQGIGQLYAGWTW